MSKRRLSIGVILVVLLTAAAFAADGEEYTLIFKNQSTMVGDVCIFQHDPDMGMQDVMSVAWFAKGAAPTTRLTFRWSIDYCFVWGEVGKLASGIVFEAAQTWEADLQTLNAITLTRIHGDIYTFADQRAGAYAGNLYIYSVGTIPSGEVAVGIGMSGRPTYVTNAQPNWEWVFTPTPAYWITFGTFEPGEALDVESISRKAAIVFPDGVYSMTAILHENNTWTVTPTQEAD